MPMPLDLVLVRHGQSEQNLVNRRARAGDPSLVTPEYRRRHGSQHRLTARGRHQAELAGAWLQDNSLGYFDRRYVSAYIRAVETAGLLGLDGPDWIIEPMLREREWGDLEGLSPVERLARAAESMRLRDTDPFYWIPPNGESIAELTLRLRPLLGTFARECSDKRVVVVCHGEVMWGWRFLLERMSVDGWTEQQRSKQPGAKMHNCQVLHYSRRDPVSGELSDHLDWMRSVSPADASNDGPGWQQIRRPRYSNKELLAIAQGAPPLFPGEEGY